MTDEQNNQNTDKNQMEDKRRTTYRTTFDLSQEAKKALEMYRKAQEQKNAEAKADDTRHAEGVTENFPDERPAPDQPTPDEYGHTTNDLAEEAKKALDLHQNFQGPEVSVTDDEETLRFTQDMALYLDIVGAQKPLVLNVVHEMIVGRGDTATNYFPEIDLTPYGAYRLGLSRRHAMLRRKRNRLQLTDLGSRNGTAVNGMTMSKGEVRDLRDGDVVRFGTLKMQVKFKPKM